MKNDSNFFESFFLRIKNDKKTMVALIVLLMLVIGATYAYFMITDGTGTQTQIDVTSNTTDSLIFNVSKDITITANMSNFNSTSTGSTQEDSATATATLRANNKTNEVTKNYYLYLNISQNDFIYSIDENTPELILMVKAPGSTEYLTGTDVASMSGSTLKDLKYVTNIIDKDSNTYAGFDITKFNGRLTIMDNRSISISMSDTEKTKTESWEVKVVFVNYNANQTTNGGRSVSAKIMMKSQKDLVATVTNGPQTYGALGNVTATGATATYNQQYNRLEITNITDNVDLKLNYTPRTGTNFAQYIIGLATTAPNQGTGKVIHETFTDGGTTYDTGYRYEGQNPNNYVWFNNELWRIIGVFDSNTHGKTGKQLVKIIRAESIEAAYWKSNNWEASKINSLLNGAYLNHEDGSLTEDCYKSWDNKGYCDYRVKGIQDGYREMIEENVTWYLGGFSSIPTANDAYKKERSGEELSKASGAVASTIGTIGLMYASDFGYSVLADTCDRTKVMNYDNYFTVECGGSSWIASRGTDLTITAKTSGNTSVWFVQKFLRYTDDGFGRNVSPALYLNSSVRVFEGNGTKFSPYIIGI